MAQHLEELDRRRSAAAAKGRLLYVPRLGVTVLAHVPNPSASDGGWVCTVVGATGADLLPVGACVLSDLEIETAIETVNPAAPLDSLAAADFTAVWFVRVYGWCGGGPGLSLAQEIAARAKPELAVAESFLPTVTLSPEVLEAVRRRLRTRTRGGLFRHVANFVEAGFLADVTPAPHTETLVYALTVAPARWWKTAAAPPRLDDSTPA